MTALAGEPLPVEFWHGSAWYPGVLLGWQHDADGNCQVRVRFLVGGLRRTSWMPLDDVRLPEPEPTDRVVPRQSPEPRTLPDMVLPVRDWPEPLPAVPAPPQPRSRTVDLRRV
jgi:hypothetical protein